MHSFLSEKESCQRTQLQTKEGQGTSAQGRLLLMVLKIITAQRPQCLGI